MPNIKVLVIDDSAVTRQVLRKIISSDPELDVVDTAMDAFIAMRKIEKFQPDVITLDLELPKMDGITLLKEIMRTRPMPVVIISSVSEKGSRKAIEALEAGAVDVITKPDVSSPEKLEEISLDIHEAIKAACQAKVARSSDSVYRLSSTTSFTTKTDLKVSSSRIIAIGASTGGTEAIKTILTELPTTCPGIVIAQHMPELFTKSFAERLNGLAKIIVKEAEENDEVVDGCALIAPGDRHMMIVKKRGKYYVHLNKTEKVNRHRPSVDVLFKSVAKVAGCEAQGILLTGMGEDGANGLFQIKSGGGHTIAQDKASSIVFGMPRRAIEIGAACEVMPLSKIASFIITQNCTI